MTKVLGFQRTVKTMDGAAREIVDEMTANSKPRDMYALRKELDMHELTKVDSFEDSWEDSLSSLNVRDAAHATMSLAHSGCGSEVSDDPAHQAPDSADLHVVTWNIAAPNNNSFEYWVTHDSADYIELMTSVQNFIDDPGHRDVKVVEIFSDEMFQELVDDLCDRGISDLDQLVELWRNGLREKRIVSGFLKDKSYGDKRLISMPDRVTNSIRLKDGSMMFRPTPISGCQDDIADVHKWWPCWRRYMFEQPVSLKSLRGCETIPSVFAMLEPIPRAKYPALSASEEAMSMPLQALCLAIFDAVLVHLLSLVAPRTWQPLKRSLHKLLYEDKIASCVSILADQYASSDIIFLQEASQTLIEKVAQDLTDFAVLVPTRFDDRRCQNSVILVNRRRFRADTARDLTDAALSLLPARCTQDGDLCVFEVEAAGGGGAFVLASFHGDSAGGATRHALAAVRALVSKAYPSHTLVIGADANTTSHTPLPPPPPPASGAPPGPAKPPSSRPAAKHSAPAGLTTTQFRALLPPLGLAACWADDADAPTPPAATAAPSDFPHPLSPAARAAALAAPARAGPVWTTCSARTFLQPQLQKAVRHEDLLTRRSTDLKDWVLFDARRLRPRAPPARDNTGRRGFCDAAMPSQNFPSDHAIVAVVLRPA